MVVKEVQESGALIVGDAAKGPVSYGCQSVEESPEEPLAEQVDGGG